MISEEALKKFKKIYKKQFKKDISNQDALEQAASLLRMVELVYKPMTIKQFEALQKRRKETGDIK